MGDDGEYIEGPSKCVDHILSLNKAADIASYVKTTDFNLDVTKGSSLYLQKLDFPTKEIFSGPRFGLPYKNNSSSLSYLMKNYRFVCFPEKVRKGRVNVVLGLLSSSQSPDQINQITKVTKSVISKYTKLFEEGKSKNKSAAKKFEKKLNTDDFCRLSGILVGGVGEIDEEQGDEEDDAGDEEDHEDSEE
eukprot:TRINITY_DN16315_c0_g1_i1.p1 TRINITY_DN16315_c0_g1~~TRINITY_DN16315_c0_g1_i1.p1  ORF type:complete len:216 (+),score=52.05 TRINITY_DN16315_c0_g1_i1:80-649(+)